MPKINTLPIPKKEPFIRRQTIFFVNRILDGFILIKKIRTPIILKLNFKKIAKFSVNKESWLDLDFSTYFIRCNLFITQIKDNTGRLRVKFKRQISRLVDWQISRLVDQYIRVIQMQIRSDKLARALHKKENQSTLFVGFQPQIYKLYLYF